MQQPSFQLGFWGHRGSQTDHPLARAYGRAQQPAENSLAALTLALNQGASGVEVDVVRCADDLVITHSHELSQHVFLPDGTADFSHGYVRNHTLAALKNLRVGVNRDGIMPTLDEVLSLMAQRHAELGRHPTLNLEIKDAKDSSEPDPARADVVDLLVDKITKGPLDPRHIVVSSFALEDLCRVAKHRSGVALGMLFYGDPNQPLAPLYPASPHHAHAMSFTVPNIEKAMQCVAEYGGKLSSVHPEARDVTLATLQVAAAHGLSVNPWFMAEKKPSDNLDLLRHITHCARQAGVPAMHLISNFSGELSKLSWHGFAAKVKEADASGLTK
ncbi:MAG: glycerophosphodiester phosphodiesterase [Rickettsiales bacterium]|nr:glycerophosphodiester phosphodiesterase [Rickettsiales bacterium]